MIRPWQRAKSSSSAGPTLDSDGAIAGRSAFVESPHRHRRPSRPSSASRETSAGFAVDRGLVELVVARDQDRAELGSQGHGAESGIECAMWTISSSNGPS